MDAHPPRDAVGAMLGVGSLVLIPRLPQWLVHDLPADEVTQLRFAEGKILQIAEIDSYGYVWIALPDGSPWFCLRPEEVLLATCG